MDFLDSTFNVFLMLFSISMVLIVSFTVIYLYLRKNFFQQLKLKEQNYQFLFHDKVEVELKYKRLVEMSPGPIAVHNQGKISYVNPAYLKLIGAKRKEELVGTPILNIVHPDYQADTSNRLFQLNEEGDSVDYKEVKLIKLDGTVIDVESAGITMSEQDENVVLNMVHDITGRKKAEDALRESEEKYRLIADYSQDMIRLVDESGIILYASPSHHLNLGMDEGDFVGKHIKDGIHPDDIDGFQEQLNKAVKENENFTIEVRRQHENGQWIWIESHGTPIIDDEGSLQHLVFTCRNITERKQYEERLEYFAFHDPLTGLPNRRSFTHSLEQARKEAARYQRKLAVLFMDLDKFKSINDTWGHEIGDELLKQFAERVKSSLRESDIIARLGGDEFIILLPELQQETDAYVIVERIIAILQKPWQVGEHSIQTTSSIGISIYPDDAEDSKTLIKHADLALYHAKEQGRNNYQRYVCETPVLVTP